MPSAAIATFDTRRFLAFSIGKVPYVIDILSVVDVCPYATPIPVDLFGPPFEGVILRGQQAVPVVDMRSPTAAAADPLDAVTATILVTLHGHVIGLVVDEVIGIIGLNEEALRPLDTWPLTAYDEHVSAIRGINGQTLILFDSAAFFAGIP